MIYISNELSHHGVKGMKWGVRKEYVPKGRNSSRSKGVVADVLSDPDLGPLAIYASMAVSLLAIHGAKRVSDLNKQGWFSEKYKASDIKRTHTTKEQDLKMINPMPKVSDKNLYDLSHSKELKDLSPADQKNVMKAYKDGWFTNCVYCTTAGALRRQGYDIEAKNSPGRGHSVEQTMKWWKGSKVQNFLGETETNPKKSEKFYLNTMKKESKSSKDRDAQIAHMEKTLRSQGNGAYGDLRVHGAFSGHSVEYAVSKSGVKIYDNQFKTSYNSIGEFLDHNKSFDPHNSTYIRLDNCTPNLDAMLKDHAIKPRGK